MSPDIHALVGAYAVDALSAEERATFAAHLGRCGDCRREVDELRTAATNLAVLVESAPPPSVRDSVLAAVRETRQESPRMAEADPAGPPTRRRVLGWFSAAAAIAAVGIGGLVWSADDRPESPTERVLQASDAHRMEEPVDGTSVALVRSRSMRQAVLVADRAPEPPEGMTYQVWLDVPGRGMVSAGMVPRSGPIEMMLHGDAMEAESAGITVEPASGSSRPSGTPVAVFAFD